MEGVEGAIDDLELHAREDVTSVRTASFRLDCSSDTRTLTSPYWISLTLVSLSPFTFASYRCSPVPASSLGRLRASGRGASPVEGLQPLWGDECTRDLGPE